MNLPRLAQQLFPVRTLDQRRSQAGNGLPRIEKRAGQSFVRFDRPHVVPEEGEENSGLHSMNPLWACAVCQVRLQN